MSCLWDWRLQTRFLKHIWSQNPFIHLFNFRQVFAKLGERKMHSVICKKEEIPWPIPTGSPWPARGTRKPHPRGWGPWRGPATRLGETEPRGRSFIILSKPRFIFSNGDFPTERSRAEIEISAMLINFGGQRSIFIRFYKRFNRTQESREMALKSK